MAPSLTVVLIALAFILFWSVLLNFIAYFSGWWSLAARYAATTRFEGKRRRFRSLQIGTANMGGCVTIGTNVDGLYLAVILPFRPGHPPLFVPWSDVRVQQARRWFSNWYEFRFANAPGMATTS